MTTVIDTLPSRRRFDVDEYHAMARAGILMEGDRVELIAGEIVEMHTIGSRHHACVMRLNRLFTKALGDRVLVSIQGPVRLDRYSEPEPDVALLRPRADDYAGAHAAPSDTLLIIEVADSSLAYDRQVKLPLYARSGVPEVWIVDLDAETIDIHRQPAADGYRRTNTLQRGSLSPEAFPDLEMEITEILPPSPGE